MAMIVFCLPGGSFFRSSRSRSWRDWWSTLSRITMRQELITLRENGVRLMRIEHWWRWVVKISYNLSFFCDFLFVYMLQRYQVVDGVFKVVNFISYWNYLFDIIKIFPTNLFNYKILWLFCLKLWFFLLFSLDF